MVVIWHGVLSILIILGIIGFTGIVATCLRHAACDCGIQVVDQCSVYWKCGWRRRILRPCVNLMGDGRRRVTTHTIREWMLDGEDERERGKEWEEDDSEDYASVSV